MQPPPKPGLRFCVKPKSWPNVFWMAAPPPLQGLSYRHPYHEVTTPLVKDDHDHARCTTTSPQWSLNRYHYDDLLSWGQREDCELAASLKCAFIDLLIPERYRIKNLNPETPSLLHNRPIASPSFFRPVNNPSSSLNLSWGSFHEDSGDRAEISRVHSYSCNRSVKQRFVSKNIFLLLPLPADNKINCIHRKVSSSVLTL